MIYGASELPDRIAVVLALCTLLFFGGLCLLYRAIHRSEREKAEAVMRVSLPTQHTKVSYLRRLREERGQADATLWGEIGDALDTKSGWRRTPDVVLEVLEQHPDKVVDFLLEKHGYEQIKALLEGDGL